MLSPVLRTLQHFERTIFELREFVESKSRETDYELVKAGCLKVTQALNAAAVRQAQQTGGSYAAQAKGGGW
jgi:hypothetical protein